MNYSIPCVHNFSGVADLDVRICFENSTHGFSNNFDISFNRPFGFYVLLKILEVFLSGINALISPIACSMSLSQVFTSLSIDENFRFVNILFQEWIFDGLALQEVDLPI